MSSVCRCRDLTIVWAGLISLIVVSAAGAWEGMPAWGPSPQLEANPLTGPPPGLANIPPLVIGTQGCFPEPPEFVVKMAYGRTFGTCTELDYATLELSKRMTKYPAMTLLGPATGEVQCALLASYVFYNEGSIERTKRLNFHDGYEFGWVPKGRFTFPCGPMGLSTYVESGAGIGYVSETYRNSGSRWNWSLLGGVGFERCLVGQGVISFGLQWRHLSNGNMWGKGDELHNSNSGTDMIQGMAAFVHRF